MRLPFNFIRTFNLSKVPWKWIIVVFLIVVLVFGTFSIYDEMTRPEPIVAITQGLAKTINARTYRYEFTANNVLNNKRTELSRTTGEKNTNAVHIKSELPIIKANVELYHIGDIMYRRDCKTNSWLVVKNQGRAAIEMLIAEINPLGVFHFDEFIDVKYVGKEKIKDRTCWAYEIMTKGENKFLELYWKDFNYKLWVDKKDGMIRKAVVTAEHRDNSQRTLEVNVFLWDFDETIEISPPII